MPDVFDIGEGDLKQLNVPPIEVNLHRNIKRRLKRKYGTILCRLKIAKRKYVKMRRELREHLHYN
jgi:hypothetical protein